MRVARKASCYEREEWGGQLSRKMGVGRSAVTKEGSGEVSCYERWEWGIRGEILIVRIEISVKGTNRTAVMGLIVNE